MGYLLDITNRLNEENLSITAEVNDIIKAEVNKMLNDLMLDANNIKQSYSHLGAASGIIVATMLYDLISSRKA